MVLITGSPSPCSPQIRAMRLASETSSVATVIVAFLSLFLKHTCISMALVVALIGFLLYANSVARATAFTAHDCLKLVCIVLDGLGLSSTSLRTLLRRQTAFQHAPTLTPKVCRLARIPEAYYCLKPSNTPTKRAWPGAASSSRPSSVPGPAYHRLIPCRYAIPPFQTASWT